METTNEVLLPNKLW